MPSSFYPHALLHPPLLRLTPTLRPCRALYPFRLWSVQVARWDPAFIIRLSPARHRRAISPNNTDLVGWIDFLGAARGLFGAFAAFATAALLWEKSADPGAIDEVTGASKGREEEEIEEDSVDQILWLVE